MSFGNTLMRQRFCRKQTKLGKYIRECCTSFCGPEGLRSPCLRNAIAALYQVSYGPVCVKFLYHFYALKYRVSETLTNNILVYIMANGGSVTPNLKFFMVTTRTKGEA